MLHTQCSITLHYDACMLLQNANVTLRHDVSCSNLFIYCTYFPNIVCIVSGGPYPANGPIKVYYVSLLVFNYFGEQVIIKWTSDDGNFQKINANNSSTYIDVLQVASSQPSDVNFTAFTSNGSLVYLNNVPMLEVTPTEEKYLVKVVAGKNFILFYFITGHHRGYLKKCSL